MPQDSAPDLLSFSDRQSVATAISDRQSQELIIALVGPIGSGVTTVSAMLAEVLRERFGYLVSPVLKPSDVIRDEAIRVGIGPIPATPLDLYVQRMQDAGNKLREKFGNDYLAQKLVERIFLFRKQNGGITAEGITLPGRRAYIIDSIKHTDELTLLKQIYGDSLCIVGVFAPDALRSERLKDRGVPSDEVKQLMSRDRSENHTFGQQTKKVFVEADFFVCNDRKKDECRATVDRYLDLLFGVGVHTPTRAEFAMYEAAAASANSACLSRQVGASILSSDGELIGTGWNDVPRFGGGLYREDDQTVYEAGRLGPTDKDFRCFKWKGCECHNETRKTRLAEQIEQKFRAAGIIKKGVSKAQIRDILKDTEINSLIEFSRAIHAEMEAILAVAREARHSLVGASLFTTTYPCHNCARHIVAAGLKSVLYIEPYDKSLATDLHSDSVSENPEDVNKVVFRQYHGVAPRNYLRLFRSGSPRKKDGKIVPAAPKTAVPLFKVLLDAQSDYEAKVIADLAVKEQSA